MSFALLFSSADIAFAQLGDETGNYFFAERNETVTVEVGRGGGSTLTDRGLRLRFSNGAVALRKVGERRYRFVAHGYPAFVTFRADGENPGETEIYLETSEGNYVLKRVRGDVGGADGKHAAKDTAAPQAVNTSPPTAVSAPEAAAAAPLTVGRYYALVIGINDYKDLPHLKTAEGDAQAVASVLRERLGFDVSLLLNATRQQIVGALNKYRRELNNSSNLLIYYAGHGYRDREVDKAYWLPVDAAINDNSNWISADDITINVKGIPAKHVLIISDSCYSGTLARGINLERVGTSEREQYIRRMLAGTSRTLIASGGNEPVADGGEDGHSIFASALLRALGRFDSDAFTAEELFYKYVREYVSGRSEQTPEYNPLRNSGHESGDFVFVRKR